jgi:thiol-disulfide isomerase/thioredoxin
MIARAMCCALLAACASARVPPPLPAEVRALPAFRHRGRVMLVDLFASWCQPCKAAAPFHVHLREQLGGAFDLVFVDLDESPAALVALLGGDATGVQIVLDPKGEIPAALEATAMPTLYLFDRRGVLRYSHASFEPSDGAEIERQMLLLLDRR